MGQLAYPRALLKISGEALAGGERSGIDFGVIDRLANELVQVSATGVQLGLVVGGGNIVRGAAASDQPSARSAGNKTAAACIWIGRTHPSSLSRS